MAKINCASQSVPVRQESKQCRTADRLGSNKAKVSDTIPISRPALETFLSSRHHGPTCEPHDHHPLRPSFSFPQGKSKKGKNIRTVRWRIGLNFGETRVTIRLMNIAQTVRMQVGSVDARLGPYFSPVYITRRISFISASIFLWRSGEW